MMIERRSEPRARLALRVEVLGTNARGEGFSESVMATSLSRSGAMLSRVKTELRCGHCVTVKYGDRRAQFRIVWVVEDGREDTSEVAIHRIDSQRSPWEELLPREETAVP